MAQHFISTDRRTLLRNAGFAISVAGTVMLAGCGGSTAGGDPVTTADLPPSATVAGAGREADKLNLVLNLEYLGAQFYSYAATGSPVASTLTGGTGGQGYVLGGRKATLSDDLIAQSVAEIAADKAEHLQALRDGIGASVPAMPTIDFSVAASTAFTVAGQAAGYVPAGQTFDPFASDDNLLLGALLLEQGVAAAYRALSAQLVDPALLATVQANLADAIFHGGLIRTMLADRATTNPALATDVAAAIAMLARLDGSASGDQTLTNAMDGSSNMIDGDGLPIPFTRTADQIRQTVYLSTSADRSGGFFPQGAQWATA